MSDLRIQYDEEMVGAGHATKSDTLNRLFLGGGLRAPDGKNHWAAYKRQDAAPATGDGELALFAREEDGVLALFVRLPGNGPAWRLA